MSASTTSKAEAIAAAADAVVQRIVDGDPRVPGVVAGVTDGTGTVYLGAAGVRDLGTGVPMETDDVFAIFSTTKAITGTTALQLVEQGGLDLDAPATEYLPALGEVRVLDSFDDDGNPVLRAPKSAVTTRQLLLHTAGFGYDFFNESHRHPGAGVRAARHDRHRVHAAAGHRGTARHDAPAGGRRQPHPDGVPAARSRGAHGWARPALDRAGLPEVHADVAERRAAPSGEQVLKPETVEIAVQNHLGDLEVKALPGVIPSLSNDAEFFPGRSKSWALTFMVNDEDAPTGRHAGSIAWAGLANLYYWIDRNNDVAGFWATQIFPFAEATSVVGYLDLETAVYGALTG